MVVSWCWNGSVPRVNCRQHLLGGPNTRIDDALGPLQRQEAIGRDAPEEATEAVAVHRRNDWPRLPSVKIGMCWLLLAPGINGGGLDGLVRKHRQVLSDDVAEVGAEHADVEAATVAQAQHCLSE